jgi:myo-inositol-1(or 4)-monophosphatase
MRDDLELAAQAAHEAGDILLSFFKGEYEVGEKGEDNPLTEADLASDKALCKLLRDARPGYGWLSEETVDAPERLEKQRVWIVDPLDGTKEFIQGVAQFSVSIGLVEAGRAVLGVVYNPVLDEMFAGIVGQGATLNGAPIHASETASLKGSKILASRSEMKRGEFGPFEADFEIEAVGSIAYKLALIAAGKGDSSFSMGPKHEWDVCAGVALVEAAGGRATARDGAEIPFNQPKTLTNGILVANAALHAPLVERCAPLLEQYAFRFKERG